METQSVPETSGAFGIPPVKQPAEDSTPIVESKQPGENPEPPIIPKSTKNAKPDTSWIKEESDPGIIGTEDTVITPEPVKAPTKQSQTPIEPGIITPPKFDIKNVKLEPVSLPESDFVMDNNTVPVFDTPDLEQNPRANKKNRSSVPNNAGDYIDPLSDGFKPFSKEDGKRRRLDTSFVDSNLGEEEKNNEELPRKGSRGSEKISYKDHAYTKDQLKMMPNLYDDDL